MGYFVPVHGHPNYVVSSDGEVVSIRRGGFKSLRLSVRNDGYLSVGMGSPDGRVRTDLVHRVVLGSFVGPCPEGLQCRHLNGNQKDNRLDNLKWGTPKENSDDRTAHGNNITGDHRGTLNGRSKITADNVREIRSSSLSGPQLGAKFGVDRATINMIRRGETWRNVC